MLKRGHGQSILILLALFFLINSLIIFVSAQEAEQRVNDITGEDQQELEGEDTDNNEQETDPQPEEEEENPEVTEEAGDDVVQDNEESEGEKVKVCHIPPGNENQDRTIEVSRTAVESHLAHGDYLGECEEFEGDVDEELGSAGISSGFFHGIDVALDRILNSDLENRKERIAEIRRLVSEERFDEARELLILYNEFANSLEKEVSPEEREEAQISARAIRSAIREIENEIPDEDKKNYREIIEKEKSIEAAAEIASKIKELCTELSKLDHGEFYRVCKTEEDGPRWQKDLFDDLTDEQEKEARVFFEIMSSCFKTSGRECNCEEIPHVSFASVCIEVRPLAVACDEGDESACDELDEKTEEVDVLLEDAPHLQRILSELEEFEEDRFDNHMPRECVEAGATTPRECMETMFRIHAPEECQKALENGEIDFSNEREARQKCEEIMFRENAPQECIEAGLQDHRECGRFMFERNAPQECIDAGLTGEGRDDHRKCEEIMRGLEGGENFGRRDGFGGRGPPDHAVAAGFRCKAIQDSNERLKCFDEALNNAGERGRNFEERFRQTKENERRCAEDCSQKGGAWDFSNGVCNCRVDERYQGEFNDRRESDRQFAEECSRRGGRWDCSGDRCNCYTEEYRDQNPQEEGTFETRPFDVPPEGEFSESSEQQIQSDGENIESDSESSDSGSGSSDSSGSESSSESGSPGITGNAFLEYYYN